MAHGLARQLPRPQVRPGGERERDWGEQEGTKVPRLEEEKKKTDNTA